MGSGPFWQRVFEINISEHRRVAPFNISAYYQVASGHLYISCVTLRWEAICLQDAEERVHGTADRKHCMLGDASLHIDLPRETGIFRFKDREGNGELVIT